jgi:hypothetical protein
LSFPISRLLAKLGLFQGPHESLGIGVALGIVVARKGLVDLRNAAGLHQGERCGLTALAKLATGVLQHKRAPMVAALPGRSTSLDEIPKVQRQPMPQSLQVFAEAYGDNRTAMAAGVFRRPFQHGQTDGQMC